MKNATIVGAGLVGSLWAVFLSKLGYKVQIFESRSDLRKTDISAGKSINLALSHRGWHAFELAGVKEEIEKIAIPMYGRTMHDLNGNLTFQPYGINNQAIYSVPRAGINCKMMDIAENYGNATINYNEKCIDADLNKGILTFKNTLNGKISEVTSDVIFACDGAFSAVRYHAMQKLPRFNYSQNYIEDGYKEILLPANHDGSYKMEINSLHIWPRGRFMLIALPNEDGSFTCTLFMPFSNHEYAFDKLKNKSDISNFFKKVFPDFYDMMPNVADQWEHNPLSALAIIRCFPWHHAKGVLMGDAAHATVPFYGQGMNAGFEDCTEMWRLYHENNGNWDTAFQQFSEIRKPNGDALQDLSLYNYHVMRDFVSDPEFLLQKRLEKRIEELYPNKYLSLYSQVSFSSIPYAEAYEKGMNQDKKMKQLMLNNNIQKLFDTNKIDELIHQIMS